MNQNIIPYTLNTEEELPWIRKAGPRVLQQQYREGVTFLTFPLLEETGLVRHGFTTRLGGVSEGIFASMNLSAKGGDREENVRENYRRMAVAIGTDPDRIVLSQQTHTTNIRLVTEEDAGKGYCRDRNYTDIDGLITNVPGITLVTHYADCVPLFFVDPVHRAIGLSHSGWRGTVGRMGKATLEAMAREFGTDPKDVLAAIGPSICRDCYEVSEDVAIEFRKLLDTMIREGLRIDGQLPAPDILMDEKGGGKYQLDLWAANRLILLHAGILPDHLQVTDLCTCCNASLLHSHRATHGRRGTLGAFLCLN